MLGPTFDELAERGDRFRAKFNLVPVRYAVYAWHDTVGHCLFQEFTPPTLEGEWLAGRHQWLVMTRDFDRVLREAPQKFDDHLMRIGSLGDAQCEERKAALLSRLEEYLRGLVLFDNLEQYDLAYLSHLRSIGYE